MKWVLLIVIGNFMGASDVKDVRMTEAQCKRTMVELVPARGHIGATCVGPEGEAFTFEDAEAQRENEE